MDENPLGRSGLTVSRVGLGCNNFGRRIDRRGVARGRRRRGVDAGITFFDTADIYGNGDSERFLGEALAGRRTTSSSRRSSAWTCRSERRARGLPRLPAARDRGLARAARPRLRRPLLLPPPRRRDAARGDDRRDGRARREGKVRWLGLSNVDPPRSEQAGPSRQQATAGSSPCRTSTA